jgi:hypothetical protein
MEKEENNKIDFLDVEITKEIGGKLGHKVYRKPTHTDRYLNNKSNHHPQQKRGVIKTLIDRAKNICQPEYLDDEVKHVSKALISNGFTQKEIDRAIHPRRPQSSDNTRQSYNGRAFLPYIKRVTDRIGKTLTKYNIKTIYLPTSKISQNLRSVKDKTEYLKTTGVYRIPCNCEKVYIGQTKRSIKTRISEHQRNCRLGQTDKSAIAEHILFNDGHRMLYEDTTVLSRDKNYHTRLYREAIEIHKHNNNINKKEETLKINNIWHHVLNSHNSAPDKHHIQQRTFSLEHRNTQHTAAHEHIKTHATGGTLSFHHEQSRDAHHGTTHTSRGQSEAERGEGVADDPVHSPHHNQRTTTSHYTRDRLRPLSHRTCTNNTSSLENDQHRTDRNVGFIFTH